MIYKMDNSFDISSIFMVIVNKNNKKVLYFLLASIMFASTSIGTIIMYNAYENILIAETLRGKNICILQFLVGICSVLSNFCLVFVCDWKRCVEFIKIWSQTGLQEDQDTINYIKSERKKYRLIHLAINGIFTVTAVLFNYLQDQKQPLINVYQYIGIAFTSFTYGFLLNLVNDFPLQFSLIICAVFSRVNQRLEHLIEHPDSIDDNIKSIRLMHSVGSQLTIKADQFLRYFTAVNYFITISFMLVNLYSIIYLSESLTDYFAGIGLQFVVILVTAISIYYSIKINHLASKGFHPAYQLTFTDNSPNHFAEASLLIFIMGRNDIGLTFANLFTITGSFVTSLITLCITFILAFPTIQFSR